MGLEMLRNSSHVISLMVLPVMLLTAVVGSDFVFICYFNLKEGYFVKLITQSYLKKARTTTESYHLEKAFLRFKPFQVIEYGARVMPDTGNFLGSDSNPHECQKVE